MVDNIMRVLELIFVLLGVLTIVYKNTQVIKIFEKMCGLRHKCIDSDIEEIKIDIKTIEKDVTANLIATQSLVKSDGK